MITEHQNLSLDCSLTIRVTSFTISMRRLGEGVVTEFSAVTFSFLFRVSLFVPCDANESEEERVL